MTEQERLARAVAEANDVVRNAGGGYNNDLFIAALAKRVTVKPEPLPKKVWSVSDKAVTHFMNLAGLANERYSYDMMRVYLNFVAPDIIRERPDLVAAEWERRYRKEHECVASGSFYGPERDVAAARARLFPELDP